MSGLLNAPSTPTFLDPDAMAKWLPPHGFTGKVHDMPGEMQVTIALRKVDCGTELEIVQEGLPSVIPVESCYLGWRESLSLLAHLVEAEIPE